MESMTNAPYLVLKGRTGYRLGHGDKLMDHMFYDGLEDAYEEGRPMGTFAEECAELYQFTREAQDNFAITSVNRAQAASNGGVFEAEIAPVTVKDRKGDRVVAVDQAPFQVNVDKIPTLKAVFRKNGTVTPATSSSISDGAAALVLTTSPPPTRRARSRWRRSSPMRATPRSPTGSPPLRLAPSARSSTRPAGRPRT